jgi:predicted GIY-YIG superfamily endonuclease
MFSVYILECADGSHYVGMTENLERRLSQHDQAWFVNSYTSSRLPVKLVWHAEFTSHDDAFQRERQIKGWSRAKKQALIQNDFEEIQRVVTLEHLWRGNGLPKSDKGLVDQG